MSEKIKTTKGRFKIAGFVNGCNREKFVTSKTYDTGITKQVCTFGVRTSEKNETWVTVEGFDSAKAKFQKFNNQEKKNDVKEVKWEDRFNFKEEGYRPIFGVSLSFDESNYKTLFPFDAVDELQAELTDNMQIYIEGNIEYKSWKNDQGELRRMTLFKPTKIKKSTKEINFNDENFEELNLFEQEIIYIDLRPHPEQPNRFVLEANVIMGTSTEPTVEEVEFIIEDKKLATTLKKNLKPYNAITVFGRLVNSVQEEEVSQDDEVWGEDSAKFNTVTAPKIREMIITKAYKNTLDKTTYSEELINNIKQAKDSFGNTEWDETNVNADDDDVWGN